MPPGAGTRTPFLPGPGLLRSRRCARAFVPLAGPFPGRHRRSSSQESQPIHTTVPISRAALPVVFPPAPRANPRPIDSSGSHHTTPVPQTRPSSPAAANHIQPASSALPEKFDCRSPPAKGVCSLRSLSSSTVDLLSLPSPNSASRDHPPSDRRTAPGLVRSTVPDSCLVCVVAERPRAQSCDLNPRLDQTRRPWSDIIPVVSLFLFSLAQSQPIKWPPTRYVVSVAVLLASGPDRPTDRPTDGPTASHYPMACCTDLRPARAREPRPSRPVEFWVGSA